MKTMMKLICVLLVTVALVAMSVLPACAETEPVPTQPTIEQAEETSDAAAKAMPAAIVVGVAALAGALGMGLAIGKSVEGISRQPEAAGSIRTSLMLGLIFIETVVIYALIVAILIVFIL